MQPKGIRDDTTCIVIDISPTEKPPQPVHAAKKTGKKVFKSLFRKKPHECTFHSSKHICEPDMVEELFEDGSAMLSERFASLSK